MRSWRPGSIRIFVVVNPNLRSKGTRWKMADFQNEDVVEVIATGRRGRIETTGTDEKQEAIYWVEFNRNFATREWY
jgi:hypothetical protein